MRLGEFDFELPRERIAARPAAPRDAARLLEVRRDALLDHVFRDLPELLRAGDLLVFNDTKVIPARLAGRRGEAKVAVTLHKRAGPGRWRAFARPAKRLKAGDRVVFAEDFEAAVAAKGEAGEVTLDFGLDDAALGAALQRYGAMPLPPYIPREAGPDARDRADYQTVYAAREGAVAAPTAGLHFTPDLLDRLAAAGIGKVFVTLSVGAGTFLPVKAERVADHVMHAEWGAVNAEAARAVAETRAAGGRIVAVGTTSLRLLESAVGSGRAVAPFEGETDIFITPGFRFRAVDLLITNFHLPRSTLFMLVAAFSGLERMKSAYAHAVAAGYRFYSYGDACLLHPEADG
jgi:S-adenosylmethionine:tRNA ribosyltransferase-isomerase